MKLSLACIAGNAEAYIDRFLDCFQPLADEVIIVRACGNQKPDKTLDIARKRGCRVGTYSNALGNDWPHVDDFAAARNKAFEMARGEMVMWADLDDVLPAEEIPALRGVIEDLPADCEGLLLPYRVPEDGVQVVRERVIRKGVAKWRFPVHEALDFGESAPRLGQCDQVCIVHAPEGKRGDNDQRNLRILESVPEDGLTLSLRFHLFQSLRAVGRIDEAIAVATETVQMDDIGDAEKYELLVSLAQLSEDMGIRAQLYIQALATAPDRREAYGEMVLVSIAQGKPAASLGYARAMLALPSPNEIEWNMRRKYYGWLGRHLMAMAYRANGMTWDARTLERNAFIRAGRKISLVHATRGRPAMAFKTRCEWFARADNPDAVEHIFAIDADDEPSRNLQICECVPNTGFGSVPAWNAAAEAATGEVLVQLSDDWLPPHGWDTMILDALGDLDAPKVLAVSDGARGDDLLCMAILTRKRYEDQGWMFHPDFFTVYSDNWFSAQAFKDEVVVDARDRICFEHRHPAFGKGENDATYQHCNSEAAYTTGRRHLSRLEAGTKTSWDVEGWCNFRAFYTSLADTLKDGEAFVEIGTWMGQSLIHLAQRCQDLGKAPRLFAVDTFQGELNQPEHVEIVENHGGSIRGEFEKNIRAAAVHDMVTTIEGDSAESAGQFKDGELAGVFIDAAHDYDSVVRDIAAWAPKVRAGGIISGHDFQHDEVRNAVEEHADANGWKVGTVATVWQTRKPE